MKLNWPLMENNIPREDLDRVIEFLETDPVLTQSKNVKEFETEWSDWLGVKYSVFVNSGSSANILTMSAMKHLYGTGEIILPPLTWVSDISSVIFAGFRPVFVDINPRTLCMNDDQVIAKLNENTKAVFLTHAQGFNGLSEKLLRVLEEKKIPLLEDVCESHGAEFKGKKLGSFGLVSNFSFYYAHHMTTIEGGMISTNDKKIYELSKILRSHGMVRESKNKNFEKKMINKYKELSPKFIFLYPTLNFRNTEIGAVIGINQLKSLDTNNLRRTKNFEYFFKYLDNTKYWNNFDLRGSSNYAFPIILQTNNLSKRNNFERALIKNNIEFRRGNAGGGNQLRQPYLKTYSKKVNYSHFKNVEHVHNFGYYIGNFPDLKKNKILQICKILNAV